MDFSSFLILWRDLFYKTSIVLFYQNKKIAGHFWSTIFFTLIFLPEQAIKHYQNYADTDGSHIENRVCVKGPFIGDNGLWIVLVFVF